MSVIESVLGDRPHLIGVVHVGALAGSPGWSGDMRTVIDRAVADAGAYERAGFSGVIIENYGDGPFERGFAGRGAVAGLAAVGAAVSAAVGLPLGVNVLRNDALSAVAVAAATGASLIRVNVHTGAAVTDQGLIQGEAAATLRAIARDAPGLVVFADVHVKHAQPLVPVNIERAAADAVERGKASALIVTGEATGTPAPLDDVERIRTALPQVPVYVGSGVTEASIAGVLEAADGIIVGSACMKDGRAGGPVIEQRARALAARALSE
ncbi:MAG: BtpA/SgcQ family protein [Candidatus Eisenbacteria bacterium]|nr:BtpA/SgcQ family protein [Candidatus Eisenbacteria bacterium]